MSVDQLLLEQAAGGRSTLRFYQWSVPTLSLGYFQSFRHRDEHAESRKCPWLRRSSGGGAILHDVEVTYSYATPSVGRSANQQQQLYDGFHDSLVQALASFHVNANRCTVASPEGRPPFLCFQRHTVGDVLLRHHKIMGTPSRRYKNGLLQHGSLLLRQSTHAPQLPGISELENVSISHAKLIEEWQPLLSKRLGIELRPMSLTKDEHQRAAEIEQRKFGCSRWNEKR